MLSPAFGVVAGKAAMHLEQGPGFRKTITPWYDSETICWAMIAGLAVAAAFGLVGIDVARDHPQWHGYMWLPMLLVALCALVILSIAFRLARRYAQRYSQ